MLENYEYSVERNFLDVDEVVGLTTEFNRAYADIKGARIHENVIQFDNTDIQTSKLLNMAHQKIEAYFTDILSVTDIQLAKVWLVRSKPKDTNTNVLPYLPHFDQHRYLKAMVYLHEVKACHGPIHFGKLINPSDIDRRRKSLPKDYKKHGLNSIHKDKLASNMTPILGKAGDVVFFDTNSAHCAGIVEEGFERRVIRFDFDVKGFNQKPSIINRVVRRFFNRSE